MLLLHLCDILLYIKQITVTVERLEICAALMLPLFRFSSLVSLMSSSLLMRHAPMEMEMIKQCMGPL